ncbi:MAG: cytochrome b [Hyphomicrobiales bacterium]|nr:cytochrome b [Hyphomicrobiales bacterium]
MSATPSRYHPLLVALHWITAILIIYLITIGTEDLEHLKNTDPDKIGALSTHIILGATAVFLTLVRMAMKRTTALPAPAATGSALIDKSALAGHILLYLVVLFIGFSGVMLAIQTDLIPTVFFGSGTLPADFFDFTPRKVHGILTKVMLALVAIHVAAALYHQFYVKDRLFARMWFGRS